VFDRFVIVINNIIIIDENEKNRRGKEADP